MLIYVLLIVVLLVVSAIFCVEQRARKPKCKCDGCAGKKSCGENGSCGGKKKDSSGEHSKEHKKHDIPPTDGPFFIKPTVQLGTRHGVTNGGLEVVWSAMDEAAVTWSARARSTDSGGFVKADVSRNPIPVFDKVPAHVQFRALLNDLTIGAQFTYEILRNDIVVFTASATMIKPRGSALRVVAFGDFGEGNPGSAKVVYQALDYKPEMLVVPGDWAYKRGRLSEYLQYVYPVINNDQRDIAKGGPLLRSTLTVSCTGNHCVGRPNFTDVPNLDNHGDLFAYFYQWSQPLNGPFVGGGRNSPMLLGDQARQDNVTQASGGRYPRMSNYSFDNGDVHWLFLDSNVYMDWTSEDLRDWVRHDLSSCSARWKIVVFHHPSFTSHTRHKPESRMRLIADILQEMRVDMCIVGHAHWYERTYPLKFELDKGKPIDPTGAIEGKIEIDRQFDGIGNTRPNGIIYLVTGAGGASLHHTAAPGTGTEPFTYKLAATKHSFTVIDFEGLSMTVRQISEDNEELDRFTVIK